MNTIGRTRGALPPARWRKGIVSYWTVWICRPRRSEPKRAAPNWEDMDLMGRLLDGLAARSHAQSGGQGLHVRVETSGVPQVVSTGTSAL